ncbi:hypothetical protein [uncultured Arthrobacter sp.]|uniref:hypothetical protein n=1 Tax=uncultured Arthrobacter sp. TaxID=114050 RepID=UPI0032166D4A
MSDTLLEAPPLQEVKNAFLKAITKPDARSLQAKLGPSEVGGCAYCTGYTMAAKLCAMPDRDPDPFGYAAWLGTGLHYYLEHKLDLVHGAGYDIETFRETKLKDIFEVEGYGAVSGSCDLMVPDWCRTFDYKFPGSWSYDKVAAAIAKGRNAERQGKEVTSAHKPSMQYRVQQQIYAQGWIQAGYQIDSCVIIFLPRHTNAVSDVIFWEEPVNPELYQAAIANVGIIWSYVTDGELDDLPSDPDCFTCGARGPGRGNLTTYRAATT